MEPSQAPNAPGRTPTVTVWSAEDRRALSRLAAHDAAWKKVLQCPELFGVTSNSVRVADEALDLGAEVVSLHPGDESGFEMTIAIGTRYVRLIVSTMEVLETVGSWDSGPTVDRALADHFPCMRHSRVVSRGADRVDLQVGVPVNEGLGAALERLMDLGESYQQAVDDALLTDGYGDLVEHFRRAGLAVPLLPTGMTSHLRAVGPWWWSTLEPEAQPTRIQDYLLESDWLFEPVPDHVTLSHGGHGMNSYALTLRMAFGPLALIVQDSWGGAFGSPEDLGALATLFGRVGAMIKALEGRGAQPASGVRGRNAVVEVSGLRGVTRCRGWDHAKRAWVEVELQERDPWADLSAWIESIPLNL